MREWEGERREDREEKGGGEGEGEGEGGGEGEGEGEWEENGEGVGEWEEDGEGVGLEATTKDTVVEGTWLQTERTITAMSLQFVHSSHHTSDY